MQLGGFMVKAFTNSTKADSAEGPGFDPRLRHSSWSSSQLMEVICMKREIEGALYSVYMLRQKTPPINV